MSWVLVSENRPSTFSQMTDWSTGLAGTIVHAPFFEIVHAWLGVLKNFSKILNSTQAVQSLYTFAVKKKMQIRNYSYVNI